MEPIEIVAIFSGSASSLQFLKKNDPNYGVRYKIVCAISNKKGTSGEIFCKENGINFIEFNTKRFCEENEYHGKLKDMPLHLRIAYYEAMLRLIKAYNPNFIVLSGFMLEITEPLLGSYPIANVHPADLSIKDENGKPKYTGDNAVELAINSGEKFTASTIHFVEKEVDCGKIICISDKLLVEDGITPQEHQDKMKYLCDGPAYQKALEILCMFAPIWNE